MHVPKLYQITTYTFYTCIKIYQVIPDIFISPIFEEALTILIYTILYPYKKTFNLEEVAFSDIFLANCELYVKRKEYND